MGNRFRRLRLKVQKYPEIPMALDIVRMERDDGLVLGNREIRTILPNILLSLLEMRRNLLGRIRCRLCEHSGD